MPIYEQGYRHWKGTYTGHALRWWTVAKNGVRTVASSKARLAFVLIFIVLSWLYPIVRIFILSVTGGNGFGEGLFYDYFNDWQWLMVLLMNAFIGAGIVSNDLRTRALHIYLSKPLRRIDYILGKWFTLALWLATVTLLPAIAFYVGGLLTTNDVTRPENPWELLGQMLLFQAVLILAAASVVLALSSFTKKWAFALVSWIGLILLSDIVSGIISGVSGVEEWLLLSFRFDIQNVAAAIYGRPNDAPDWGLSLLVVAGVTLLSYALFTWRVATYEVEA